VKTKQTSPFLWRTVASERKRLEEDVSTFIPIPFLISASNYTKTPKLLITNEWNHLAMLQAITIYILLRIFDEDSFSVDFDNDLIQTMTAIAIKCEESGFLFTSEVVGELPVWSEWILMESKRRFVLHFSRPRLQLRSSKLEVSTDYCYIIALLPSSSLSTSSLTSIPASAPKP
jgi:hypothetical protein